MYLPDAFIQWALPKLPSLVDARSEDARLDPRRAVNFPLLLQYYVADLENQPFARPGFADNLAHGGEPNVTVSILRKRAESFLINRSNHVGLALLASYESKGIVKEARPKIPVTAIELWAATDEARIRELTLLALGITAMDSGAPLPDDFEQKRGAVVEHEFASLSADERADWHELAYERMGAMIRGETDVIAIHDRQATMPLWLYRAVHEKLRAGLLRDVVIHWNGYYLGAEDLTLRSFHGQVSTYGPWALWLKAPGYEEDVEPAWVEFACSQAYNRTVVALRELPPGTPSEHLDGFRNDLEFFVVDLFKLQCALPGINKKAFWAAVEADPHKFVAPYRLPDGIDFRNPRYMCERDFRTAYAHIWLCHVNRDAVNPDLRFVYSPYIINQHTALSKAQTVRLTWDARKSAALAAEAAASAASQASSAAAPGSSPPTDVVTRMITLYAAGRSREGESDASSPTS